MHRKFSSASAKRRKIKNYLLPSVGQCKKRCRVCCRPASRVIVFMFCVTLLIIIKELLKMNIVYSFST